MFLSSCFLSFMVSILPGFAHLVSTRGERWRRFGFFCFGMMNVGCSCYPGEKKKAAFLFSSAFFFFSFCSAGELCISWAMEKAAAAACGWRKGLEEGEPEWEAMELEAAAPAIFPADGGGGGGRRSPAASTIFLPDLLDGSFLSDDILPDLSQARAPFFCFA